MFQIIVGFILLLLLAILVLLVIGLGIAVASVGLAYFVHWLTPDIDMGMAFLGSAILMVATVYFVAVVWRFIERASGVDVDGIDDIEEEDNGLPFGLKLAAPDPYNPSKYRIIDPIDMKDMMEADESDEPNFPRSRRRRSSRKRR